MKKTLCALFCALILCMFALAADTNMDGGGSGGMGSGSGGSFWNPGDEGVRVTLVDAQTGWLVKKSIDLSNCDVMSKIQVHFGELSKLYYARINPQVQPSPDKYRCYKPNIAIPTIISSSSGGSSNMEVIRKYFSSAYTLQIIADYIGVDYGDLCNGKYKLVIEPISYFKFEGVMYAMTATEAACYDKMLNGQLRAKMVSLTHKNLPLSMFLQTSDLGFPAWGGGTNTAQSNNTIISALGIGIIYFDTPPEAPDVATGDFEYHTDTDVITSVYIAAGGDYTPDMNAVLTFTVGGQSYSKPYICPSGSRQLVWFKWHTPSTPQTMTITLGGVATGTLTANIIDLSEKEPPDPKFSDSSGSFNLKNTPSGESTLHTSWSQWFANWIPGDEDSPGYWDFYTKDYAASLNVKYDLIPADRVQTEINLGYGNWEMKSGYGAEANVSVRVSGQGGVSSADVTPVQHIEALFPEFGYETYNRLLRPEDSAVYNTVWHFKPNRYSYYSDPVQFVPLWYPDDTEYPVPMSVMDAWTPGGQLQASVSDSIRIDGSAYDDWYIRLIQ